MPIAFSPGRLVPGSGSDWSSAPTREGRETGSREVELLAPVPGARPTPDWSRARALHLLDPDRRGSAAPRRRGDPLPLRDRPRPEGTPRETRRGVALCDRAEATSPTIEAPGRRSATGLIEDSRRIAIPERDPLADFWLGERPATSGACLLDRQNGIGRVDPTPRCENLARPGGRASSRQLLVSVPPGHHPGASVGPRPPTPRWSPVRGGHRPRAGQPLGSGSNGPGSSARSATGPGGRRTQERAGKLANPWIRRPASGVGGGRRDSSRRSNGGRRRPPGRGLAP